MLSPGIAVQEPLVQTANSLSPTFHGHYSATATFNGAIQRTPWLAAVASDFGDEMYFWRPVFKQTRRCEMSTINRRLSLQASVKHAASLAATKSSYVKQKYHSVCQTQ